MTEPIDQYIKSLPVYQQLYGRSIDQFCLKKAFQYPVLEKKHLITAYPKGWYTPKYFQAQNDNKIVFFSTSGTTGDKIHVLGSNIFYYQQFSRICYAFPQLRTPGSKRYAVLTTANCSGLGCVNVLEPYSKRVQAPEKLALNHLNNPFLWKKADIERMREEILRFKPNYLSVDPIYLAVFVLLSKRYQISLSYPSLQLIVYTFEYAPRACVKLIQEAFQLPAYSVYGMSETGIIYVQTPTGPHRLVPDNVSVNYKPVNAGERLYELYLTATNNELMPLIHYKTGDLVVIQAESIERINNQPDTVLIESIAGRLNQCLLANEYLVSVDQLDRIFYHASPDIYLYRVVQHPQIIEVIYVTVTGDPVAKDIIDTIKAQFETMFNAFVSIKLVRSISPTPSGKFLLSGRQV